MTLRLAPLVISKTTRILDICKTKKRYTSSICGAEYEIPFVSRTGRSFNRKLCRDPVPETSNKYHKRQVNYYSGNSDKFDSTIKEKLYKVLGRKISVDSETSTPWGGSAQTAGNPPSLAQIQYILLKEAYS